MNQVKITVKRITTYPDLMKELENPILNPCEMVVGQEFIVVDLKKPEHFCDSAWQTLYPFIKDLADGVGNFYNGWMKDPMTALISCNDGFRPVSFYLEVI